MNQRGRWCLVGLGLAVAALAGCGAGERLGQVDQLESVADQPEQTQPGQPASRQASEPLFADVPADQLNAQAEFLPDGYEYHSSMRENHGTTGGIVIQQYLGPAITAEHMEGLPPGPTAAGAREQLYVALTNVPVDAEDMWSHEYSFGEEFTNARSVAVGDSEGWLMDAASVLPSLRLEFMVEPGLLAQITSLYLSGDELIRLGENLHIGTEEEPA